MEPVQTDPEDVRELIHAAKIIYKAIADNQLQTAYVMEVLQALYAQQASQLVSYEEYCKKIDIHKIYFKHLWEKQS
jgi:hypothetical protein